LTVYSRIILWVQPPVKELPTFPFLGFYSHNVTARHGIKVEEERNMCLAGGNLTKTRPSFGHESEICGRFALRRLKNFPFLTADDRHWHP